MVAIESGSNNCFDHSGGNARRSRDWSVCMLGTETQVLQKAVYFAGACEGGMLKPRGRDCTPEAYIRRIRRLIAAEPCSVGGWIPEICVATDDPIAAELREMGIDLAEEKVWGRLETRARFDDTQLADFFHLVDRYHQDLSGWSFARVYGLPAS